ncbi:MAG TPA: hypothetical protein VGP93_05305 [Polyangiaceae bacterium]|nr:hypothetical protein [Polyangiaceae bacterium]
MLLLPACGGGLPLDAFREGRYPAAAEELRELEGDARKYPAEEQARYALYRGLTHLALGDARQADHWLVLAKRAADRHPTWFDRAEMGSLISAWRSLGRMPGE